MIVTPSEETNIKHDPQHPHMSPLEMSQPDDTSHNAKSGETTPEEKPTKMVAIEASKETNSDDTLTQQMLETWLRGAPPSLVAMFQQGNYEAAMRNIRMGLGQLPVLQEDENSTEILSPERTNSMPSQASTPFPEASKGNPSEKNYKYGKMKHYSNSIPPVKAPSASPPEYRAPVREQSRTNNGGNASSIPPNPSGSTKYRLQTPSPVQNEQENPISERNRGQFSTEPAPSNSYMSTKHPNSGDDAVRKAVEYPLSPPESPVPLRNTGKSNSKRKVIESRNDSGKGSLGNGPDTENNDFNFGLNGEGRHYYAEPDLISPNEGQHNAAPSQNRQSSLVFESTSVHDSHAESNDMGSRSLHSRHPGTTMTNSSKLHGSATPISGKRPPHWPRTKSISRRIIRSSDHGPGYSRPDITGQNTINLGEGQRSATPTPHYSGRVSIMPMKNNSVDALETEASQSHSLIQSFPSDPIKKVESQKFSRPPWSQLPQPRRGT